MSKVIFDTGISLDGFMAGENRSPENPIGDNGTNILSWMFSQKAFYRSMGQEGGEEDGMDSKLIDDIFARTGAYIMGKRMFEEGETNWPEDLFKADVYVLTHEKREPWVQKGTTVFHFVNDSLQNVLEKAKESAQGKDVRIQGGGNIIQQYLNAGLVDEFMVHISPIIISKGIRLFEGIDKEKVKVEIKEVIPSPLTTHIRYETVRQ